MMGLGYFGSSSSSSNLSPLAPPFTVDRSNHKKPNLNSHPDSHFNDPSYGVPFNSPWPYSHTSTARQGLLADSITTATIPFANSCVIAEPINPPNVNNWPGLSSTVKSGLDPVNPPAAHLSARNPNPELVTNSSSYNLTEAEPFYPPCALLASDVPLVALNKYGYDLLRTTDLVHVDGSSQVDCSQSLSGLKYDPQQVGIWSGLAERSRRKSLDSEHSFFSGPNIAGAYGAATLSKGKEDSALFPGMSADLVTRENNIGPLIIGKSHGASFSAENHGLVSSGFSKEHTFRAFPMFSESHPLLSSPEPPKELWSSHRSYTPYEKRSNMFDCSSDLIPPSITKSSPLVIKPPAALSTFSAQGAVCTKSGDIGSIADFNSNNDVGSDSPLKERELQLPLGCEAKGNFLALNQLKTDICGLVDLSSMREDVSNKMLSDDRLNFEFKTLSNFQVPDIHSTEDAKSVANLSEHFDHHNPAEDSPCWKGAPTHFSPFGSPEAESPQHPMKKLQTSDGVNLQGFQPDHSFNHASKVSSFKPTPTEKQHKSDGALDVGFTSGKSSKGGAQSSHDVAKLRKGYGFLSKRPSDASFQTSQMELPNLNEDIVSSDLSIRSTGEAVDHTVHAVENIMLSVENAGNHATAKHFDVNVLVKALSNLSELLLLYCTNDECGLKEQDHKALHHVIGNLDNCILRKIQQVAPTQTYTMPHQSTSNVLQEGAYVSKSVATNETTGIVHGHGEHLSAIHWERNNNNFGKNMEKLQGYVSLSHDEVLAKNHDLVQKIKEVLDENLECKEELPSQTLLYKNLWLEAEAELCALRYRARFDRVKRDMNKSKSDKTADVSEIAADMKISSSDLNPVAPKLIQETGSSKISNSHVHNPSLSNADSHIDDVENSVMTRFNILKCRGVSNPVNVKEEADVEAFDNEIQSSGVAEGPQLQRHVC